VPTRRLFALLLLAAPFGAAGGPFVLLASAIVLVAPLAPLEWPGLGNPRLLPIMSAWIDR